MNYRYFQINRPIFIIRRLFSQDNTRKMSRLSVRLIPNEERMKMTLNFSLNGGVMKTYNMERMQTEQLGQTLTRMKTNILSKQKKKRKRKNPGDEEELDIAIKLTKNNEPILDTVPNKEAFVQGTILHIDESEIQVDINPPVINSLKLPESIMAGFPVFPKLEAEFFNLSDSIVRWYRCKSTGASDKQTGTDTEEVCQSIMYTPDSSDIGHRIKLVCTPKKNEQCGIEVVAVSNTEVNAGPGMCPFDKRHMYTSQETPKHCFRVVTYNILADIYADSEYSRDYLYPYCPHYALHIDYRKQLLLKELAGYKADVICLQEVDKKVFNKDLLDPFNTLGYQGELKLKAGTTPEGEAIFFRTSKFRLHADQSINISEVMKTDPLYTDIYEKVSKNEVMENSIQKHSVLQVLILESVDDPKKKICVGNTHFFFHPKGGNIRLIQVLVCIRHLENIVQQYQSQGEEISVIFCGDFNSTPHTGVNRYVTTGLITADTAEWTENDEEHLLDMEFKHGLKLRSACGYPEYTNYVGSFSGCLDYIFVDTDSIEVTSVVPSPDHEDVVLHTALPSVVFPSDHIAQICDLKWIKS